MAAMNPSGLRRNLMNIVHNYTDAQVKVREATSNDPWGPSSTLMSEIADLTYNMVAFSEIMMMIWKRLNDHGKNWRHVYKALILLEYMIKTGSEKVAQQCKENIFAIQTLKDFQYLEENRDQGVNVREKAKQLVTLLKDDERLKNERARALKAKERLAQSATGIGHEIPAVDGGVSYRYPDAYNGDGITTYRERRISSELECARPQTAGEEELQLQLALAMSKEEADQEDQKKRSDDVRLQMAITQSEEDFSVSPPGSVGKDVSVKKFQDGPPLQRQSNLLDLLDVAGPGTSSSARNADPWGMSTNDDTLATSRQQNKSYDDLVDLNFNLTQSDDISRSFLKPNDSWVPGSLMTRSSTTSPIVTDPWTGRPASSLGVPTQGAFEKPQNDPWSTGASVPNARDPWGAPLNESFGSSPSLATNGDIQNFDPLRNNNVTTKKTPGNFLGENSALVNLDSLIGSKPSSQVSGGTTNPFAPSTGLVAAPTSGPVRISLNDMRGQHQMGMLHGSYGQQQQQQQQAAFPINSNSTALNQFNGNGQQMMAQPPMHGMVGMQPMANNPFL